MKRAITLACLVLAMQIVANAQLKRPKVESLITNGKSRNWKFNEFKTSGKKCSGDGQLFTFFKDGKVQHQRCVDGKIKLVESSWKLEADGDESRGEWKIVFEQEIEIASDNRIHSLNIDLPHGKENTPDTKMIWRTVADCKGCTQTNLTLLSTN